jgi:hypothetical protein
MTSRLTGICFAAVFALPIAAIGGVVFITSPTAETTRVVPHHDGSDSARIDAEIERSHQRAVAITEEVRRGMKPTAQDYAKMIDAIPAGYTERDLGAIVDAAQHNEARFNRDYKGRNYSSTTAFKAVSQQIYGGYSVQFTDGSFCMSVTDSALLGKIADWPYGRPVMFGGTIEDTSLGHLMIKNCRFWS